MKSKVLGLLAVGLVAGPMAAHSAMVTFRVSGAITSVDGSGALLPFPVAVGDLYTAEYTFNTQTADSDVDPTRGEYLNTITAMTFNVGSNSYSFSTATTAILVFDDFETGPIGGSLLDDYQAYTESAWPATGLFEGAGLEMYTYNDSLFGGGPPLDSDALPTSPPDPGQFPSFAVFYASFSQVNNGVFLSGDRVLGSLNSIERLEVAPVPLPAAGWLLLSGLAGLGLMGRRRQAAKNASVY